MGAIPFYKIGRLVRFDVEEVRAALRASKSASPNRNTEKRPK